MTHAINGRLVLDADWADQPVIVSDDGSITVPEQSIQGLLKEPSKVLSGNPLLIAQRVGAGLKPIPEDGEPVAGAVSAVDGQYALFTHSGATLGLILGELLAEEILTGTRSPVLEPFGIDRFGADTAIDTVGTGAWAPVAKVWPSRATCTDLHSNSAHPADCRGRADAKGRRAQLAPFD